MRDVPAAGLSDLDRELEAWLAGDPVAAANGADLWRALREAAPVHRHRGMVVVSTYELARGVMRDHDGFSSDVSTQGDRAERSVTSTPSPGSLDEVVTFESMLMNRRDGSAHAELRTPFAAGMVRRQVEGLRQMVDAEAEGVVARLEDGPVDLAALARELTGRVVCRLIGSPGADWRQLHAWVQAVAESRHNVEPGAVEPALLAWRELAQYTADLVRAVRASRASGPLSHALVASYEDGAAGPARAAAHLMSILGGQDSTATAISRGVRALEATGGGWRRLAADPELTANAVEEVVRFVSPSQVMMRRATAATELGGVPVRPEETVVIAVAGANRDPEVFADPERLDIERPNANRHLGFGYGRHHCLGIWLARAQIAAALRLLAARGAAPSAAD